MKAAEFLDIVRQSAHCYTHISIESPRITPRGELKSFRLQPYKRSFKRKRDISTSISTHRTFLHEKYLKTDYSITTKATERMPHLTTNHTFFITKPNIIYPEKQSQTITEYKTSYFPICSDQYRLYSHSKLRNETLLQFMNKTNVIAKGNYFKKIKQEMHHQLQETHDEQIQAADIKQYALTHNKKILDGFDLNFLHYLKKLHHDIEQEKTTLKFLENDHEMKAKEKKRMNDRIALLKKQLTIRKEYKQFMILVKYHVTKIAQLPHDVIIKYFGNDYCSRPSISLKNKQKQPRKSNILRRASLVQHNEEIKRLSVPTGSDVLQICDSDRCINELLFSTPEEFNNEFKEVEEKVLKMFIFLTEEKRELISLTNEKDEIKMEKEAQERQENTIIEEKEMQLALIKRKHLMLSNELKPIKDSYYNNDTINTKIKKKLQHMLLNVSFDIERELHYAHAYDHLRTKNDIILVFGQKINPTVYYLELVERLLLTFLEKNLEVKKYPKKAYEFYKLMSALEARKRLLNSRLKIKEEKERRERLNEDIMKKTNKVHNISYRKTDVYLSFNKRNQLFKSKKKYLARRHSEELSINDIIHFE